MNENILLSEEGSVLLLSIGPSRYNAGMQQALALFDEIPTLETLRTKREDQWFDRKSFRIEANGLANALIGFANADGGRIVVGINDGKIEGVDSNIPHLNDLMQAAIDYTLPPVRHAVTLLNCTNATGQPDRLLLLDVEASESVHRSRRQECFLRVGDETRRLSLTEEQQLVFDKGEAVYDKTIDEDAGLADLDMEAIQAYATRYGISSVEALMRTRGLTVDTAYRRGVTQAGVLLFGKYPPIWSYVRYLRYDGTTAETGTRSNVTKDIRFEGPIPTIIEQAKAVLTEELKVIRLTPSGRFEPVLTLPEFAWLEAVVNAVTHRSYSLHGDGIRVKQFSDRLEIDSPGRLPGLVRVQNIRHSRFARNPHIARVLAETTTYVRESNEGVERMFEEMEQSGLRPPVYTASDTGVRVTLYKLPGVTRDVHAEVALKLNYLRQLIEPESLAQLLATFYERKQLPTRAVSQLLGISTPTSRKYLGLLAEAGLIVEKLKAKYDPAAMWVVTDADFWTSFAASTRTLKEP